MQLLIKKTKVFLSGVILKDKTGGKMLKNCYFSKFCQFCPSLQSVKSLQSSRLHENIQSLIKKLTVFYMGLLYRRKMGENPQKSLFFAKKILFLFMINYILKRDKLLIPHYVYFFSIKLGSSKLRTKSCDPLAMG